MHLKMILLLFVMVEVLIEAKYEKESYTFKTLEKTNSTYIGSYLSPD